MQLSSSNVSGTIDLSYDIFGRLDTVTTESTAYHFVYDAFGNTTEISAGDYTLAEYSYRAGNGKLDTLTYGNGRQVKYSYDSIDRIEKIEYNTGENGGV